MHGSRWQKPLDVEPGHWKKQLPGKHLNIAARGDLAALEALLDEHPQWLDRRGNHGRTFLFEAVRKGRVELVQRLLSRGAEPNLTGCYNSETLVQINPLTAASWYRRDALTEPLRAHGACNDVFRSAFAGNADAVLARIDRGEVDVDAEDPEDEIYFTPLLSFAISAGHADLAGRLIDRGADVATYGVQTLFLAAMRNRGDLVELLLAHGANPEAADATLWMATDDLDILRVLVAHGLSANQRDYNGLHPLAYAARADKGSHTDKIGLLLELGADVNATGTHDRTALHYAATAGSIGAVQMLLAAGADRKLTDHEGRTPLALAVARKKAAVVKLLK